MSLEDRFYCYLHRLSHKVFFSVGLLLCVSKKIVPLNNYLNKKDHNHYAVSNFNCIFCLELYFDYIDKGLKFHELVNSICQRH